MKIKVNAYPVIDDLEQRLGEALKLAKKKRARLIEIAYGTASVQVKRRILNFLMKKENRQLYNRLEKSIQGWGRIYVHFRWKDKSSRS